MKKRALTLLEVMIVIFLITLITGAIGYNMRGTLDKGRVFKSQQARDQLEDLLMICLAEGVSADAITNNAEKVLKEQGLAKDPKNILLDGWKEPFAISFNASKTQVTVESKNLKKHENKMKRAKSEVDDSEEE